VESGASAPRPAAARAHLAAAVLRRHWLAAVLLAAGLVLRVLAQFAYRPVLFYIDTARYLYNDAQGMDPVGYKGPLRVLLAVTNFNTIAAVQHLLGLAMAVVLYVLLLPAVLYLLVLGGGWRQALGRAGVLCAAFILPILTYCTINYLAVGDFFLSHTGVTSVYGRTAAAADCNTLRLTPAERGMCPTRAQQAKGPDSLEFDQDSPVQRYYADLPRDQVDALITDFNHRVLTQQPLRVLRAYARDVVRLFALTRDGSPGVTAISRWQFQTTYPYFPPHASRQVVDTATDRFGGGRPAVWAPAADFLRGYQLHGGYTPGPLLALCTLAGLAGSASLLVRGRAARLVREPARACLLFFASAVSVLLVSDLFEFSWRYQLHALVTLVPAGALGVTVLLRAASARRAPG